MTFQYLAPTEVEAKATQAFFKKKKSQKSNDGESSESINFDYVKALSDFSSQVSRFYDILRDFLEIQC